MNVCLTSPSRNDKEMLSRVCVRVRACPYRCREETDLTVEQTMKNNRF